MKNFIVPIDFSEESLSGLDMAVLFSQKTTVNIQLVNVITSTSDNLQSTKNESEISAESKFKKLIEKYEPKLGKDSKIRHIIKTGKVYKEIVNQADSYNDSVVVGIVYGMPVSISATFRIDAVIIDPGMKTVTISANRWSA